MIGFYRELYYLGYFGLLLPIAGKPPPRWEQLGPAWTRWSIISKVAAKEAGSFWTLAEIHEIHPQAASDSGRWHPMGCWGCAFLLRRLVGLHEPQQWNYVEPISMILFLGSIHRLLPCLWLPTKSYHEIGIGVFLVPQMRWMLNGVTEPVRTWCHLSPDFWHSAAICRLASCWTLCTYTLFCFAFLAYCSFSFLPQGVRELSSNCQVRYITVALILTLDFHIISYTCRHSLSLVTSWATNMVMIALGAFMVLGCFERYLNDVWPGTAVWPSQISCRTHRACQFSSQRTIT